MDTIRTGDILEVLKDSPIYSITELMERFADRTELSMADWGRLRRNLGGKLRRLVKSGYVVKRGTGEERRWEIKENSI